MENQRFPVSRWQNTHHGTQRKHDYIFENILDKLYYNLYIHAFLYTLLTLIDYSNVHKNAISHARVHSSVHTPLLDVRSIVNGSRQSLISNFTAINYNE